ncbi:HAMP domain-containing sensor histidine kinase [uncultured Nisaea sp.]|uniref:sensor histidine kinase n=1 Tax=uncultured Nisaea sp. TaxID=538215 RepID=UPI0030ECFD97|tara:strand:+ start:3005 stop:4543 length:1539 start_codon:yes stop_codon:yes gene_type:complete
MSNPPSHQHRTLESVRLTSISARYLTRFVPIILVIFTILISIYGTVAYREALSSLESKLDTLISRQSLLMGEAVAEGRNDRIGLLVAQTIADRDVATIAVLDNTGAALNQYGQMPAPKGSLTRTVAINHIGENSFNRVGTLIISMSEEPAIERLTYTLFCITLLGAALLAAASVAAHLVLRTTVSQPLDKMLTAIRIQRESGARIPIDWDSRDQIGQVVSAYNSLQLRQTKTESDLTRLRLKAERAHQSKSDFVGRVIEELRTPLNSIVGFSEIVSSQRFGPDTIHRYLSYAGNINQAARHLLHLIENVLDLTRLEGGEVEPVFAPVKVEMILRRAEDTAASLSRNKGVRLIVNHPTPGYVLNLDAQLTGTLLSKLLENALSHTPEDGRVELTFSVSPGGTASFTVHDSGNTIPEAEIERLLIPLAVSHELDERRFHGTGLSLPICKILAEMHGGTLEITNPPAGGSAVSFLLPPSRVTETPDTDPSAGDDIKSGADHRASRASVQHLHRPA